MSLLFLSHSGADTEAAKQLKTRIEETPAAREAGLTVWFDKDNLEAGKPWRAQLETALENADAFAVLVGSKGVVNWVEAEVDLALSRATTSPAFRFVPIIAKESETSRALPAFAQRFQAVFDPLNDRDELAKLVTAVTGGAWDRQPILTDEPFVGLRSMDESWANRFFGRKAEIGELVEKFKKHKLVAIVADSGAGKSSLAKAGFVPAFRGGALTDESKDAPDDKIWHVVVMRPGADPVQGLKDGLTDAAALLGLDGTARSNLRGRVDIFDVGETAYALRCDLDRKRTETLLVVDQFEELLSETPEAARAAFATFLCRLADGAFGFRILLTLRADYFNLDDSLHELRSRLWVDHQDPVFRLRRMSDAALAETAREPLALVGFANDPDVEALIRAIQRDVSDREGDLALVQMALHSVWRRHKARSKSLLRAYEEVQGVAGALAHEAEEVRSRLSAADGALLFPVLARLIRRGELGGATRRIARRDEFDAAKKKLIAHLSSENGGRLLLASGEAVEIAHEALITRWPWLRSEGHKFASDIDELARLMDKAKAWARSGASERAKYLATGADLDTFSALAERQTSWLSLEEHEFVTASSKAREAEEMRAVEAAASLKRQVLWSRTFAASSAVALVIVGVIGWRLLEANNDAKAHLRTARKNLFSALTGLALAELEQRPVNAAKLALATWPRLGATDLPKREVTLDAVSRSLVGLVGLAGLHERVRIYAESPVTSVTFSPDGKRILTGLQDNTARLWDAATGKPIGVLAGHEGAVWSVAFSPDGTRIVTGSADNSARVWDAATGNQLRVLAGYEGIVWAVAFSPDGRRVLTGSGDRTARLWDAATGKEVRAYRGHEDEVSSVAFSPDGARVLTGSWDGTARLWDTAAGDELRLFAGHSGAVESVTFSPDGAHVVTGADDKLARLWDAATGEMLRTFKGHDGAVWSVAVSPDGTSLLTGSMDKIARLWDLATGNESRAFVGHEGWVGSVAFSPDGTRVLTGSNGKTARLWDATTGRELLACKGHEGPVTTVAVSPDGARVLTGSEDSSARLWDAATGEELRVLAGHIDRVTAVAFSPDGARVMTGSHDKTARLHDAVTGEDIRSFVGHADRVTAVAFSRDGARVLTGSADKTARLWDGATGALIRSFSGHTGSVTSVAFSPDGVLVLTGSDDTTARMWDTTTAQAKRILAAHGSPVDSVAFSPDGTRVLTGSDDTTARLWDAATGTELRVFKGHKSYVGSVAFSPDGARVLTGSWDSTARLWDAATGQAIRAFKGHEGYVNSVAFSPDGARVLTGSADKTARFWDISTVPPGSLFDIACSWLPDYDLASLGEAYKLDLSHEPPICQKDASGKFMTPLPDLPIAR